MVTVTVYPLDGGEEIAISTQSVTFVNAETFGDYRGVARLVGPDRDVTFVNTNAVIAVKVKGF